MELLTAFLDLLLALVAIVVALARIVAPWWPLIAWTAFWMFAVDWRKLRPAINSGGWIGMLLIGLVMILIWGVVAPPADGTHSLLGLHVSNFAGKTMYVTGLFVVMAMCGGIQLAGVCDCCVRFEDDAEPVAIEHGSH